MLPIGSESACVPGFEHDKAHLDVDVMGKTPIAKPGYDKLFTRLAALEEMFPEQCLREPIAKLPAPRPTGLGCDFAENVYGALDVGLAETDRNLVVYRVDPSLDTRRSSCIK